MEDIYKKISDIMTWYHEYSAIVFADELMEKRDDLAILSFRLAEMMADSKIALNAANFLKLINVEREKQTAIDQNNFYNKSEVKAVLENEPYYHDAVQKQSIYDKNSILLDQTNVVLYAMNQRINYAIKEKHNSNYVQKVTKNKQ